MGPVFQIAFLVDEHLPLPEISPLLASRGHLVTPVTRAASDPAILARAETTGSLIVTADSWFLDELFRYPPGHPRCYKRAGVIQIAGAWPLAKLRITNYLPMVELLYEMRIGQPDCRVAIDLSRREIRIREP